MQSNVFEKSYCFAVCATLTLTLFLSSFQDIKRIAQSLSKAMKSPLPALELRSGQPADINTLLSLVEDIIRKQNRVGGEFYSDASKKEASMILTLGAVNLQGIVQGISVKLCYSCAANHSLFIRQFVMCVYIGLD